MSVNKKGMTYIYIGHSELPLLSEVGIFKDNGKKIPFQFIIMISLENHT